MSEILRALHYHDSPNFLRAERGELDQVPQYAHVFRRAVEGCSLKGVYVLRPSGEAANESLIPTVYFCEAPSDDASRLIHRRVYNQSVVPFLAVQSPGGVRVYRGFDPEARPPTHPKRDARGDIFGVLIGLNEVATRLQALLAESIDDGTIWEQLGQHVTPEHRVDWRLLRNLESLDRWLADQRFGRDMRHALIGKYVYLHYLRQRDILSDRRLTEWGIAPERVFTRHAEVRAFKALSVRLDEWLNGSIFPLGEEAAAALEDRHLRYLAGVFRGDETAGSDPATVQLALDFQIYDFSYIPIETLSVVYENFLHAPEPGARASRGKVQGAYYTPIPLVDFMLAEMDDRNPLARGKRVLDPACGSGAFLVQCFRRLVARERSQRGSATLEPGELSDLLVEHIFGVDSDPDACRVAEFSLTLALLDNIRSPDLNDHPGFKLPALRSANIFHADFFDPQGAWPAAASALKFDWVVGNPPWRSLSSEDALATYQHTWEWMQAHASRCPTGGNQVAEAFAWKVLSNVAASGTIALLLPAMTLFKDESAPFRANLFRDAQVWCVANFANLAYVLFGGRSRVPAAAFFYSPRSQQDTLTSASRPEAQMADSDEVVSTYAPFLANQEANRPAGTRGQRETWGIAINASEVRRVPNAQAATGDMLPWKLAMWGSHRDERLLGRVARNFATLADWVETSGLTVSEGPQFRKAPQTAEDAKRLQFVPEVVGQLTVDFGRLRRCGRIFAFPPDAMRMVSAEEAHLRKRGGRQGLGASRPPHIIVDAARRAAEKPLRGPGNEPGLHRVSGEFLPWQSARETTP